jgi:RND family efflux transporter MFP subunit
VNVLHKLAVLSVLATLGACGKETAAPALPPLPALATITVTADRATSGRSWDGVVEAVRAVALTAQTGGRVATIAVDIDDRVAAGAELLRLTAIEQQAGANTARAQLRAAEARAVEAEANYRRYADLGAKQFVSPLQLDQARASRDAALAERDAARAQLRQATQQAEYTVINAPFDGIVSARLVETGESIVPGQHLMSLYAPDAFRIEVQVPQSDAAAIRAADRARIVLADGRSVEAARVIVFPAADAASHSIAVRVELPTLVDPPQPGVTASVEFPIGNGRAHIRIPHSAVMQRGETSAVYVLAGGRLSLRQIRPGQRVGALVDVLSGLDDGDTIAADPIAALQALITQRKAAGERDE